MSIDFIERHQIWRSRDKRDRGRRVEVVSVEPRRIGYRNCKTKRLAYAGIYSFNRLFERERPTSPQEPT